MSASADEISGPFRYSGRLTEECVAESTEVKVEGGACDTLFRQHAKHYGRELQPTAARFHRFVDNVHLVHTHNQRKDVLHQITLNQFSDLFVHELPLYPTSDDWNQAGLEDDKVVHLSSRETILDVATHNRRLKKNRHHHKLAVPVNPKTKWFESAVLEEMGGHEVNIVAGEHGSNQADESLETPLDGDNFGKHLNWATEENPDGVGIVNRPRDQGSCGSCWAWVAVGTLEASASRRAAYDAYKNYLEDADDLEDAESTAEDLESTAEVIAQQAEQDAISRARLSVQELVDCDTDGNAGCIGGHPQMAFYFIYRYGLTSARDYPYQMEQGRCKVRNVGNPIATTESWGVLTTDHEDNMEMVIRWIGPIAVGIDSSDPAFLAYRGGIYDNKDCDPHLNHAVLVVGYGQEVLEDGRVVRYWIVRNTWGYWWGENGYFRIKRGSGRRGEPGVCGISMSPSVALGGTLLPKSGIIASTANHGDASSVRSQRLQESLLSNYCSALGFGTDLQTCHRIEGLHQTFPALTYGVFSVFAVMVFVVWPLTRDCRARRNRRRESRRRLMLENQVSLEGTTETESLLEQSDGNGDYGSNADNA